MEHYDVLNAILTNDCPSHTSIDGVIRTFEIELHCSIVRIEAELISTVDTIQWKILNFEVV